MIDRQGLPADDHSARSDALLTSQVEADQFELSAHRHDHEASLHDRLAADASGCLYFGFLHAAEAHRAAARRDRALADAERRGQPDG